MSKAKSKSRARSVRADHEHHLKVAHAHSQVAALLRQYPNVKGLGIGYPTKLGKRERRVGIIVWVDKKRSVRASSQLPKEILGVRVDVQVAPSGRLVGASAQGAMTCQGQGRTEFGHIAMLARRPDGKACALTTLHVLVDEQLGDDVDGGDHQGDVVEAGALGQSPARIGTITRGGFSSTRDIAQVVLDPTVQTTRNLGGTSTILAAPAAVTSVDIGAAVRVVVPSEGTVDGTLDAVNVGLPFGTDQGVQEFDGLLQFGLNTAVVRKGWCGSMVFAANNRTPLAMISFGADSGPAIAWGFPVAPHWSLWGLGLI